MNKIKIILIEETIRFHAFLSDTFGDDTVLNQILAMACMGF